MNHDCPASLTRATRTPGPESGVSAPEGQQQHPSTQASAPKEIPQSVRSNAGDDDYHESPLDNTLSPERESDAPPCKEISAEARGVSSSVTVGGPTKANHNKQPSGTNTVGQDSEVYSEVPHLGTSQTAQPHETATVDSERLIRAVRELYLTTTTTAAAAAAISSNDRSPRRSLSREANNDVRRLLADSERGAEGGNEETDTTRSRNTSDDLVELHDVVLKQIQEEKRKEGTIMGSIGRCTVMISSMSDDIRSSVLEVFGTQRLTPDSSRKSFRDRRKGKGRVVQEEDTPGPKCDFERRQQAVKAYLNGVSGESEAIPEAKAEVEEEAGPAPGPEEGAYKTLSSTQEATESSCSGAVLGCSEEITPVVVDRKDGCKSKIPEALTQQSSEDIVRKRQAARKSWDNNAAATIYDIAEQQILKGKFTCQTMLSCMKSVAMVVDLVMDAYSATELAMQKARKCRSPVAADILQAITSASSETSDCMLKALSHVEAAVRIHAEIVETTERAERSLSAGQLEYIFNDCATGDVTVAVKDAVIFTSQNAVFGSSAPQREEQASGSTCGTPPEPSSHVGFKDSPETAAAAGFQSIPADVLHNLLVATMSSFQAVEATVRAIQFFTTCDWCTGRKLPKRRGRSKK